MHILTERSCLGLVVMPLIFTPSSPTRRDRVPREGEKFFIDEFAGLESWDDPTPRPSSMTLQELTDIFVAAADRQFSLRPKSPTPEERMERRKERRRKGLIIALNTYAKRNNMQPNELEFVEEKVRNQVEGYGGLYVHSNFVVKGLDGRHSLFFSEVHPNCTLENDVVLCAPLEENDLGHCFECGDRAKDLKHPSGGGYFGGHEKVMFPPGDLDDSEEECFM
uniref:Uncharacterized protein n=1 Tax=Avena sativa TaxID=4498 RepID=A0ACD5VW01_AVESA